MGGVALVRRGGACVCGGRGLQERLNWHIEKMELMLRLLDLSDLMVLDLLRLRL